ncbi:lactonase family protein [Algivirga pacifica]
MKLRPLLLFLIGLAFTGCQQKGAQEQEKEPYQFWVGTYTDKESKGIYQYSMDTDGGMVSSKLMVTTQSPSFLALSKDKEFLLAVNEIDEKGTGTIESYAILKDTLALVNRSKTGGAHPCYVSVDSVGGVFVANYSGGNIGYLQLEAGKLSALIDTAQHTGKGTTDRQEGPHAHSVQFAAEWKSVVSADLGTNEVWFTEIENGTFKDEGTFRLPMAEGAGPRHMAFHPNQKWLYVINELNSTITTVVKGGVKPYEVMASISTLPMDFEGENYCAHIRISDDGKYLYASNRGHNSIAVFQIDQQTGVLSLVQHTEVKGDWPRHFELSPDGKFLLVANQRSDNITVFKREEKTGMLTYISEMYCSQPVCIVFQ